MKKAHINYSFTEAILYFKPWKGKINQMLFYIDESKSLSKEIKSIVKGLKEKKEFKRRKIIGIYVFHKLNISL